MEQAVADGSWSKRNVYYGIRLALTLQSMCGSSVETGKLEMKRGMCHRLAREENQEILMSNCTLGAMTKPQMIDFLGLPDAHMCRLPNLGNAEFYCACERTQAEASLTKAVDNMTTQFDTEVWQPLYGVGKG